jgi:hypothetical protein
MKRIVFSAVFLIVSSSILFAEIRENLQKILPSQVVSELLAKGSLQNTVIRQDNANLKLVPRLSGFYDMPEIQTAVNAPYFIESLYLYKKTIKERISADETERISVILRSISHLEGLEYYSSSRKKMRTLYEKSYAVAKSDSTSRIPDPTAGSADGMVVAVLQKDLTFGENFYTYKYRQSDKTVGFFSTNTSPLRYTVIKLIDPGKLQVSLFVHDFGDYLLVYGLTSADAASVPGLESKITQSFTTRSEAIYKWFISEYEK